MTNFSIGSQLPIYLGLNGAGLNNGKIYFGLPNQDPQTFPKTVYWDEAGTDPVDQTNGVPTIGGYISNAGNPATIYVDGPYSVRARDRFGSQVFYIPEASGILALLGSDDGASLIGMADGGNVQDAIAIAENTQALIALTKPMTVGSYVGTADGFIYKVAPAGASDHHLTTAGGVKLYVIPQGPDLKQWGVIPDMGVDMWRRIQNALDTMPDVLAEEGEYQITRGLRQTLNGSIFRGAGIGKTVIKAISPTGDNEFGGTDGNEAVVWAMGGEGDPVIGLKTEDMTLDCAGLMTGLPVGDVRLKGHHYRRVWSLEVNRVEVIECGSYAFWANDKTIESGGTITGCEGVYNDCVAKDAEIFFETTGRCFITYNRPRAEQTRGTWAWPVQQTFHFYGGDGFIRVNDAYAKVKSSTVIGPLLTQKNVVWNGGYYEQLDPLTTVINMDGSAGGDWDNWAFNDCTLVGAGQVGALSFGAASGSENKMTVKGGRYEGKSGTGLTFTATTTGHGSVDIGGADCISTTTGLAVPFSLIVSGTFKHFRVSGGNQEVYGPSAGASPVNAPTATFEGVTFLPASSVTETIRQSKRISAVFASGGGGAYGQINFAMPLNIADQTKLVAAGCVAASTTALGGGEAVAYSRNNPSANFVNILAPPAAIGRTWTGIVTEYL